MTAQVDISSKSDLKIDDSGIMLSSQVIEQISKDPDIDKLGFSRITFVLGEQSSITLSFAAQDSVSKKTHCIIIHRANNDGKEFTVEELGKSLIGGLKALRVQLNVREANEMFVPMLKTLEQFIQRKIDIIEHDTECSKISADEIVIGVERKDGKQFILGLPVEYTKTVEKVRILMINIIGTLAQQH